MELCRTLELWAILAITYFNPLILPLRKGTLELTFSKSNIHLEAELGIEPKSPDLNVLSTYFSVITKIDSFNTSLSSNHSMGGCVLVTRDEVGNQADTAFAFMVLRVKDAVHTKNCCNS